jgi:hypothetical protein
MRRTLENRKKLTPIQIMNRKNSVNSVNISNQNSFVNNNCKEQYLMNNVSCEDSWDEYEFVHIVAGVELHPNFRV